MKQIVVLLALMAGSVFAQVAQRAWVAGLPAGGRYHVVTNLDLTAFDNRVLELVAGVLPAAGVPDFEAVLGAGSSATGSVFTVRAATFAESIQVGSASLVSGEGGSLLLDAPGGVTGVPEPVGSSSPVPYGRFTSTNFLVWARMVLLDQTLAQHKLGGAADHPDLAPTGYVNAVETRLLASNAWAIAEIAASGTVRDERMWASNSVVTAKLLDTNALASARIDGLTAALALHKTYGATDHPDLATRTYVENLVASVLVPPESAAAAYMMASNALQVATNALRLAQETLPIATNAALVASDTAAAFVALNARLNPSNMPSLVLLGSNTLSLGNGSQARAAGSAAFGFGAIASNIYAFVWNGIQSVFYGDRGPGTICLNPVGGAAGLYVGSNSLASVVDTAIGPYKRPRLLYGPADDTGFQAHSLGFDIPGLLVFYSVQGSPVSYSLDLIPIAYNTATQGVAMAQIALDRPTGTDTGAVTGVVGSVLATNKVYTLSDLDGSFGALSVTGGVVRIETETGPTMVLTWTQNQTIDYNSSSGPLAAVFAAGQRIVLQRNPFGPGYFETTTRLDAWSEPLWFRANTNEYRVICYGGPIPEAYEYPVFASDYDAFGNVANTAAVIAPGGATDAKFYNLASFPTNLVAGSNVLITGTKQNPTISALDTPGLILVSNQVVSTISTLGSVAGTQGVHSASIAGLYLTNDNTSQVIYGLFQSNSVVKTAVDYLAETQVVHSASIAGLLQSNATVRTEVSDVRGAASNALALATFVNNKPLATDTGTVSSIVTAISATNYPAVMAAGESTTMTYEGRSVVFYRYIVHNDRVSVSLENDYVVNDGTNVVTVPSGIIFNLLQDGPVFYMNLSDNTVNEDIIPGVYNLVSFMDNLSVYFRIYSPEGVNVRTELADISEGFPQVVQNSIYVEWDTTQTREEYDLDSFATFGTNEVNDLAGQAVSTHNVSEDAHSDLRASVSNAITAVAGLLQSNAEARVTLDAKLNTNGNGSALSGITASQVGAMSTSERANYYTKAEGDLSAAAKVSISSGSATNLDLYADPQTFTGLTGSVTITNRAERPIVASGTGTVSLAFTGLKQMRPVYLTLEGFSSVSVPGGYAVGGWGEWQTNQVNHFLVWTVSTNLFLNAITTSGE